MKHAGHPRRLGPKKLIKNFFEGKIMASSLKIWFRCTLDSVPRIWLQTDIPEKAKRCSVLYELQDTLPRFIQRVPKRMQ